MVSPTALRQVGCWGLWKSPSVLCSSSGWFENRESTFALNDRLNFPMWAAHASLTSQWFYGYYRLGAQCQNVPEFAGFGHSQRSQHSLLFVDGRHRVMAGSPLPLRVFLPLLRYCDALSRVPRWNTSEVSFKSLHPEKAKVLSGPLLVSILKHPTHVLSFPVTHFSTLDPRTKA